MTNLNETIAKARGWTVHVRNDEYGVVETWHTPKGTPSIYNRRPDFEHDANLYMQLFMEMSKCGRIFIEDLEDGDWLVAYIDNDDCSPFGIADTIGTAICLAWLRTNGVEVE